MGFCWFLCFYGLFVSFWLFFILLGFFVCLDFHFVVFFFKDREREEGRKRKRERVREGGREREYAINLAYS